MDNVFFSLDWLFTVLLMDFATVTFSAEMFDLEMALPPIIVITAIFALLKDELPMTFPDTG
jgi:hypothetical protein